MIAAPAIYALLIFSVSALGGVLPILFPHVSDNQVKRSVSFGAGLLLGMALLHMVPEAAHQQPENFGLWLMLGFVLILILERFMMVHSCEEHGCSYHHIGIAAFVGLSVHGVIEGLALASAVIAAPSMGPMLFLAILAHKMPAAFTLSTILKLAKKTKKQIGLFTLGLSLSGPVGIGLAFLVLNLEGLAAATGPLLGISSGTFIYIAACDLLPEVHTHSAERLPRLFLFLGAIGLCALAHHGH